MKLYAIRDRLLDYFLQPFIGPSDNQVKSAVADNINNEESNHAISQAPNQFELWRLAEIDEKTGQVGGEREYICDCTSLIRPNIRIRANAPAAALREAQEGL